jgi:hypothetical protein
MTIKVSSWLPVVPEVGGMLTPCGAAQSKCTCLGFLSFLTGLTFTYRGRYISAPIHILNCYAPACGLKKIIVRIGHAIQPEITSTFCVHQTQ